MKRIFIQILIVLTYSLFITGCSSEVKTPVDKGQGKLIYITFNEIKEKIEKKETFILQFELTTCHYCKRLEDVERAYLKENDVNIYAFNIDKQMHEFQNNKEYFDEKFGEIKDVPNVFWIFEGESKNTLPLVEEDEQSRILKLWIQDNIEYYK